VIVVVASAVMLVVGAGFAVVRAERGPSMLDRMVALDIITSILLIGVALEAAWTRRVDTVPVMVALTLVGFVASVTVARFASVEPEDAGRIRSPAEIRAEDAARLASERAAALAEAEAAARRAEEEAT
jgi:multicomponent Na+:H+ antiporter subunit F